MGDIAAALITQATHMYTTGHFSKAFDFYILAFEHNPELKEVFEPEFRSALSRTNEFLADEGNIQRILQNFSRANKIFPESTYLTNQVGKYLYNFGFYSEAWCQFQKALTLDSGSVDPEKNLNSIKNLLVERWHYRMLNDKIRNEAYHDAIKETLIPYKDSALDLGCGTGLLTLYAMKCCPIAMTVCDRCEQMAKMTECILEENNMNEVVVINRLSTELNHKDIGGKRSLIVTELFDAALFGELVLTALAHAHENLLSPRGNILPKKAEFFIVGAKCDQLHNKFQLSSSVKSLLKIPSHLHILTSENYDCEDVKSYKNIKYMTEPASLLKINFNDSNDIQDKLNGEEPYSVCLKAKENGEIDVLIGWFNLYLTDQIIITTDPLSEQKAIAWQNAVFPNFLPHTLELDKTLDLHFILQAEHLKLMSLSAQDIIPASPELIRFLNDQEFINTITRCLGAASVYLGQMAEMSEITVVDLCPFPLFGLLLLKRGAKSLTCYAKDDQDESFTKKVLLANDVDASKFTIITGDNLMRITFRNAKYHAVFSHYIHMCGDVDLRMKEIGQYLKNAHLLPGGLFMPASVTMMGQVVQSHWLDINNRVYDTNVSNYMIGKYINKYQVSQNFDLDFSCLEYNAITEPVNLGKYGMVESGVENIPVIRNGDANAVLCWYNVELMEDIGEFSTNRVGSFADGMAFLANPPVKMNVGDVGNVLRCIDAQGAFKLMIDVETS